MKDLIRKSLQKTCSTHDLRSWFEPLSLDFDHEEAKLTVLFPHAHFQPWFAQQGQKAFESNVLQTIEKLHGRSASIVYSIPKGQNPKAFFLQQKEVKKTDDDGFSSFICNAKNEFPLATAREVAQGILPPKYNPFIICGKSGTGKTHILRALTTALGKVHQNAAPIFSGTAESLAEKLTQQGPSAFAKAHAAFVVDDMQRLAPSSSLQQNLALFMDICLDKRRQIIMASTQAPILLNALGDGLRSRLEVGLIVELKEPDIDVRMRFALWRCRQHGLKLSRDHLLLLAQRCATLRHLSGVILKMAAFQSLAQQDITTADLENILRSSGEEKQISAQDIIHTVAEHMEMDAQDIIGSKRQPAYVRARQIAMFLCRDLLGLSYPALGKFFSGKDHSTVIHSIQKIKELMDTHKEAQLLVTELKRKCLLR